MHRITTIAIIAVALFAVSSLSILSAGPVFGESRIALLIGNSAYATTPLAHAVADTRVLGDKLLTLGFAVNRLEDADRAEMLQALYDFRERLAASQGMGLLYFAGHGAQYGGKNFLLPIGSGPQNEYDIEHGAIALEQVLGLLHGIDNPLNVIVLDAHYAAPLGDALPFAQAGLTAPDPQTVPGNAFIAMAASPEQTAIPGLYGQQLLAHLDRTGVSVEQLFEQIREAVSRESAGAQIPWQNSKQASVALAHAPAAEGGAAPEPIGPVESSPSSLDPVEELYWESAREDDDPVLLTIYLQQFPQGRYAEQARQRLAILSESLVPALESDFFAEDFAAAAPSAEPTTEGTAVLEQTEGQDKNGPVEYILWEAIKDSDDATLFGFYLEQYPDGDFAALAKQQLERLRTAGAEADAAYAAATPVTEFGESAPLSAELEVDAPSGLQADETPTAPVDISDLIDKAKAALQRDALTTPEEDNAVKWAQQALAMAPNDAEAQQILAAVIDNYLQWSQVNMNRGRYRRASIYLSRARSLTQHASDEQLAKIDAAATALKKRPKRHSNRNPYSEQGESALAGPRPRRPVQTPRTGDPGGWTSK